MQKNGEGRTCSSEDMIADRHTHTHRHGHYNTPLGYQGRSNNRLTAIKQVNLC